MPLVQTRGAASAQGFGEFAQVTAANYIEDMFSCFLYTGTGSSQTITNNIDLSTKGGLTWIKGRSGATGHRLTDTARGVTKSLESNSTAAEATESTGLTAFGTTGFTIGADADYNTNAATYVSWTFRKQPKFFDVVTWTGNGTAGRTIPHSLGSTPGMIIVKRTDASVSWLVWHRSLSNPTGSYLVLNSTVAEDDATNLWGSTAPNSTSFQVSAAAGVNASGGNYVAYLFAHDAGGFGLSGTDNVISCGSVTRSGSGVINVNLGYESQWVLFKSASNANNWRLFDVMRGMPVTGDQRVLNANLSDAEDAFSDALFPTATGFAVNQDSGIFGGASGSTSIYIAIRRGPMKVPTLGTSVFGLNARTGTGANATVTGGQTDDAVLIKNRGSAVASLFSSRLTGTGYLVTSDTAAEVAAGATILQANPWDVMDGVKVGTTSTITNASANTYINYLFRRAPSFFDEVCYTGNYAGNPEIYHNLGVVPELIITKNRGATATQWYIHHSALGASQEVYFTTDPVQDGSLWTRTSTYWKNESANYPTGEAHVAYLFATCAGVSKVGSYTGTGALQTINCGFTGGARFVLIKRTDSTGNWWTYDSARGISSGNDPYLYLNSTAAEVGGTNYVDTDSTGFKVTAAAPAGLNANGGTYIFLAIA